MKIKKTNIVLMMLIGITGICNAKSVVAMMPENGATDVNIDTHLVLTMDEDAVIGNCGFISVYEHKTGKLVDRIDMSIPAGPTMPQPSNPDAVYTPIPYRYKVQHITNRNTKAGTPSGVNAWDKSNYQLDIIGGFSDGFHFYPVIAHAKQLTIYLHHNMLEYGHEYHVTIEGESREGVVIHYPNNEVFNPHPTDIKTNEVRGTFPSRRAAFAADNCSDLVFRNLTVKTDCKGQAEGLLVNGERNFFDNIHIIGDGDALQANGSCYWHNCRIDGGGDTVLGRGPSFFNHCTITSRGAFMWIRNTEENRGNVFIDCHFIGLSGFAELGRLPDNKGKNYPHAECVLLNCTLENIPTAGWGIVDESAMTATLLEFNSHDTNGDPVDISKRNPLMRQLDPISDAELIGHYSDSHWVLEW